MFWFVNKILKSQKLQEFNVNPPIFVIAPGVVTPPVPDGLVVCPEVGVEMPLPVGP